jgi:NAD(P)-dependent dehydrogenase (short-subunit alcohol dehydrogenase family)
MITGSSRGLGKAIALGMAREGADIVVAARTETDNPQLPGTIHQTAEAIRALGRQALPVKCDVTDEQNVNDVVQQALDEFGHVDVLVNNAGVAFYYPIIETPLKRWELVLRVNLVGAFLCARAVLPKMIEGRNGSIINISSLAAEERVLGKVSTGVAYAVAKAGLDRFTWGLAAEVGEHNIAVNALKPKGVVDTEGMRLWLPDADKSQWESPEKMVKSAVFLAAQNASGVSGTISTDEELCTWHGL